MNKLFFILIVLCAAQTQDTAFAQSGDIQCSKIVFADAIEGVAEMLQDADNCIENGGCKILGGRIKETTSDQYEVAIFYKYNSDQSNLNPWEESRFYNVKKTGDQCVIESWGY